MESPSHDTASLELGQIWVLLGFTFMVLLLWMGYYFREEGRMAGTGVGIGLFLSGIALIMGFLWAARQETGSAWPFLLAIGFAILSVSAMGLWFYNPPCQPHEQYQDRLGSVDEERGELIDRIREPRPGLGEHIFSVPITDVPKFKLHNYLRPLKEAKLEAATADSYKNDCKTYQHRIEATRGIINNLSPGVRVLNQITHRLDPNLTEEYLKISDRPGWNASNIAQWDDWVTAVSRRDEAAKAAEGVEPDKAKQHLADASYVSENLDDPPPLVKSVPEIPNSTVRNLSPQVPALWQSLSIARNDLRVIERHSHALARNNSEIHNSEEALRGGESTEPRKYWIVLAAPSQNLTEARSKLQAAIEREQAGKNATAIVDDARERLGEAQAQLQILDAVLTFDSSVNLTGRFTSSNLSRLSETTRSTLVSGLDNRSRALDAIRRDDYTEAADAIDAALARLDKLPDAFEPAPSNISVTSLSCPDSVTPNRTFSCVVTIRNSGQGSGRSGLNLEVSGSPTGIVADTGYMAPSETKKIDIFWEPPTGGGTLEVSVGSEHQTVVVRESARIVYRNLECPHNVTWGESMSCHVDAVNMGDSTGSERVVLRIDGDKQDTASTGILSPNETANITVTWATAKPAGYHTVSVGNTSTTVHVSEPPDIVFENLSCIPEVDEGEPIACTVLVRNDGGASGSDEARLLVDGGETDSEPTGLLQPGDNRTLELAWDMASPPGEHVLTVAQETETVEVNPASRLVQRNLSCVPQVVDQGRILACRLQVVNQGSATGSTNVSLRVDGAVVNRSGPVELVPGEDDQILLTWRTPARTSLGDRNISVGNLETQTSIVEPLEGDALVVEGMVCSPLPVQRADLLECHVTVLNGQSQTLRDTVVLTVDGIPVDSESTGQLSPGNATRVSMEWDTSYHVPGSHQVAVQGSATGVTVEVLNRSEPAPDLGVREVSCSPTEIEFAETSPQPHAVNVTILAENTGGRQGRATWGVTVQGSPRTTISMSIDPGEERMETRSITISAEDIGLEVGNWSSLTVAVGEEMCEVDVERGVADVPGFGVALLLSGVTFGAVFRSFLARR